MEARMQVGWNTRIVPFGPDISSAVFALGFANRAAIGLRRGPRRATIEKCLIYNKERIFAFVNALRRCGHRVGQWQPPVA